MKVEIEQVTKFEEWVEDFVPRCITEPGVWKQRHGDPVLVVRDFLSQSDYVFVGKIDGEIACVWGTLRPTLLATEGYIWMMTTELAMQHPLLLVRHSINAIAILRQYYPKIIGECAMTNAKARRWLRWLGAKFTMVPRSAVMQFELEGI